MDVDSISAKSCDEGSLLKALTIGRGGTEKPRIFFLKLFGNIFRIYRWFGNPENSVIPNGNTEFPKILFPDFSGIPNFRKCSIPEVKKIGNGPTHCNI